MERQGYPTDLTDAEWAILAPQLPPASPRGRPRVHRSRVIRNAIFSLLRSGCAWRLLPNDLPPWQTVDHSFRHWRDDGTWEQWHAALRAQVRLQHGRAAQPSAGMVDSQSATTTGVGGPRGCAGGQQITGRQRHLLVDTPGLVLRATVHAARRADREGLTLLLPTDTTAAQQTIDEQFPRLAQLWRDGGDDGEGQGQDWVEQTLGWRVAIVKHLPQPRGVWAHEETVIAWAAILPRPGCRGVLPRRWVVERTLAWLRQHRRLSKDCARRCATGEALIDAAMTRLMVRRLART